MDTIKRFITLSFFVIITLFLIMTIFYFLGYKEIVYVMLSLGCALFVLIVFFCGVGIGVYLSTDLVRTGAGIALQAKASDDKADGILIKSITDVFKVGANAGQKAALNNSNNELPDVDIVDAGVSWEPPKLSLTKFDES